MSLADSADSAPQLLALCREAADGKAEALDVRFSVYRASSISFHALCSECLPWSAAATKIVSSLLLVGFTAVFPYFHAPPSETLTAAQP
jgi:hypothetical protein